MNVIDIMTANPQTIRVGSYLREALELMEALQIKHLPVLSVRQHLVGILSDRDCRLSMNSPFIQRTYWNDNTIDTLEIRQVMTPAPIIVEVGETALEATRLMLTHRIGCLPVMRGETLIGIITRSDLLTAFMLSQRSYEKWLSSQSKAD